MRVGLIARCDHTGVGIQSKEFFDHIQGCKAFVIDFSEMAPNSFKEILAPNFDWYPNQTFFKWGTKHNLSGDIPEPIIRNFIRDIDVLFCMETPYDYNIFKICKEQGVKTILQLNYEFLDFPSGKLQAPDMFAAPSMWNFENIPDRKVFLPVPVNMDLFESERKERTFVHIAGRPAAMDRNGTEILFRSLEYVKNEITLIVKSQRPLMIPAVPSNVKLIVECGNKANYWDNYAGGVLVMPRKYGGLCLPFNEALAAGMPVIAPDISPNNTWLPKEWLVSAEYHTSLQSKKLIQVHHTNFRELAWKIDDFCDPGFYDDAILKAMDLAETISWNRLLPLYESTFKSI